MSSNRPENDFGRRERRARQKAGPELDRESREILVARPYGDKLRRFLEGMGVRVVGLDHDFVDFLQLDSDCDLDERGGLCSRLAVFCRTS